MNLNENLIFRRMTSDWDVKGSVVLFGVNSGRYYVICHALWHETKQSRCVPDSEEFSLCPPEWRWIVSQGIFGDFSLFFRSFTLCVFQMGVNWTEKQLWLFLQELEMFRCNVTTLNQTVLHSRSSSRCASVIWAVLCIRLFLILHFCLLFSHND